MSRRIGLIGMNPKDLFGVNIRTPKNKKLKTYFEFLLEDYLERYGVVTVVTGLTSAVDIIWHKAGRDLKRRKPDRIDTEVVYAYYFQDCRMSGSEASEYRSIMRFPEKRVFVDRLPEYAVGQEDLYHPDKYRKQFEYLINNIDELIVVTEGTDESLEFKILEAIGLGVKVRRIDPYNCLNF